MHIQLIEFAQLHAQESIIKTIQQWDALQYVQRILIYLQIQELTYVFHNVIVTSFLTTVLDNV